MPSNNKKTKASFEDRLKQLTEFEEENGHMFIPSSHKLGQWYTDARRGKYKFTDEQKAQLDNIGFVWGKIPKGPEKQKLVEWGQKFKLLVNFHKSKGHCNVPAMVGGKPFPLATWCDEQRQHFGDSKLDQSKIEKLTRLGFDFFGSSTTTGEEQEGRKEPDSKKRRRTDKKGSSVMVEVNLEEFEKLKDRVEELEARVQELEK